MNDIIKLIAILKPLIWVECIMQVGSSVQKSNAKDIRLVAC